MQIWRGVFGWRTFFGWASVGTVVSILVGMGLAFMSLDWVPHNLLLAQLCFAGAALILTAKIIGHAIESQDWWAHRVIFTFLVCGTIGVVAVESVRILQQHKAAFKVQQHQLTAADRVVKNENSPPSTGTQEQAHITADATAKVKHPAINPQVQAKVAHPAARKEAHDDALSASENRSFKAIGPQALVVAAVGDDNANGVQFLGNSDADTPLEQQLKCAPPFICYTKEELVTQEIALNVGTKGWARVFFRVANLGDETIARPEIFVQATPETVRVDTAGNRGGAKTSPPSVAEQPAGTNRDILPFGISNQMIAFAFDISIGDTSVQEARLHFRIWSEKMKSTYLTCRLRIIRQQP